MITIGRRHIAVGLVVAVGLHLVGIFAVLGQFQDPGAAGSGSRGLGISLGLAGGVEGGGAPSEAAAPDAEVPVEVPVETAPQPPAERAETVLPPAAEPAAPAPVEAVPAPVDIEVASAAVEELAVVSADPPAEPPEAVALEPVPPVPTVRPAPPARPDSSQAPKPAERRAVPARSAPEASEAPVKATAAAPGSGGDQVASGNPSGASIQSETNSGDGGVPGALSDYTSALQAWLERHKEYPHRAQARRMQGTALLHFVLNRNGQVLSYRIEESSGHRILDREVEMMLERAQPLPRVPDGFSTSRLELRVPVQFFLR